MMQFLLRNRNWILFWALVILLVIATLVQDGMFMDGQQYAIVAKNMAVGEGSFWHPFLSPTWYKAGSGSFMEHPPLGFYLQSIFFRLFGESMYTERAYSFFTMLVAVSLIVLIWKEFHSDEENSAWLPLVIWITIPVCFWSYSNNLMENTMGMFTLMSILFQLRYFISRNILWFLLGALSIVAAFLCKGIPGLFPIAFPFIWYWVYAKENLQKGIYLSVGLLLFFLLSMFSLILIPEATESLSFYFFDRLLFRIESEPTTTNHFTVIVDLISQLGIATGICVLIVMVNGFKAVSFNRKQFKLFLFLGISASLPLMATGVQRDFYLVPSLPFYAMAAGVFIKMPVINLLSGKRIRKWNLVVAMLFFFISVTIASSKIGECSRDKELLKDVYALTNCIPKKEVIAVEEELLQAWSLEFYLLRHHGVSFHGGKANKRFLLQRISSEQPEGTWKKTPCDLKNYTLFCYD